MRKKLTYEFIRERFEEEGYELLSKEYIDSQTKLKYICPNGHKHSISWGHWQQGRRCFYCFGSVKPTIEFVRSSFERERYKLLSKVYLSAQQRLKYICANGHEHHISWNSWQQGHRCPYCSDKDKKTIEFIRSEFAKENYKFLTNKYKNNNQKLDYICPKGHKHGITWANWSQGKRCPYCIGNISKGEVEVRSFVEFLGIKVLSNDRNQIFNPDTKRSLELDIFMPDFNKAIEYNGEYWHLDKKNKNNNDLLKQQLCKDKNIDLLIVWDEEWEIDNEKCKSKIMSFVFN